MGFFGKKKAEPEKAISTDTLESEVAKLGEQIKQSRAELDALSPKITQVKAEYDDAVGSLMAVKKELYEKKIELDVIKKEHVAQIKQNANSELLDSVTAKKFQQTKGEHLKIKEELAVLEKTHANTKEQILEEEGALHNIQKQKIAVAQELEEANSRLYNTKSVLDKRDNFADTSILTPAEKEFIGDSKNSDGIMEAASAVVGSLKSKLHNTQKELAAVQNLLAQERVEHAKAIKDRQKS